MSLNYCCQNCVPKCAVQFNGHVTSVCSWSIAHSHLLWLDWLPPHMQWTLYRLRKITSNNFISSVTWARSTTFGNMYLLKLDESPATPQVVWECMDEQMLCDFSYFIFCGMNTLQKNIYERTSWFMYIYIYI